jgi:branched-chain amino acid transport system ATP-binding protein
MKLKNAELQLRELRVHYDKAEAVRGISLETRPGEAVALLGANGAGKTTVLKAVSGLKKITSGEIWFEGNRIDGMGPQEIVRLGITHVPEGRRLFPDMSTGENLLMGAYLRENKAEVKKSLEEIYSHFTVLKERLNQQAGKLSGGEQQMLAIGRALMAKPKLLMLDEPSIGLSPMMVAEISKVIMDISQSGISIFLVEQNSRLAFKLSQRGYVMETGRIVLQGNTHELENNAYVKKAYLGG